MTVINMSKADHPPGTPAECHGDVLAKLANATCPHCSTGSVWDHWNGTEYLCLNAK